jgi:hypothetical protein
MYGWKAREVWEKSDEHFKPEFVESLANLKTYTNNTWLGEVLQTTKDKKINVLSSTDL